MAHAEPPARSRAGSPPAAPGGPALRLLRGERPGRQSSPISTDCWPDTATCPGGQRARLPKPSLSARAARQASRCGPAPSPRKDRKPIPNLMAASAATPFSSPSKLPASRYASMSADGPQKRSIEVTHANLPALYFRAYSFRPREPPPNGPRLQSPAQPARAGILAGEPARSWRNGASTCRRRPIMNRTAPS